MSGPLDSLQQPVCGIKRFLDGSYRGTPLDPERADKVGSVHHHERTGHRARAANLAGEPPEKVAAVTSRDAARKRKGCASRSRPRPAPPPTARASPSSTCPSSPTDAWSSAGISGSRRSPVSSTAMAACRSPRLPTEPHEGRLLRRHRRATIATSSGRQRYKKMRARKRRVTALLRERRREAWEEGR